MSKCKWAAPNADAGASTSNEQHATNANWEAGFVTNPLCHESAFTVETSSIVQRDISDARTARETNSRHEDGPKNGIEVLDLFIVPKSKTTFSVVEQARADINATEIVFGKPQ